MKSIAYIKVILVLLSTHICSAQISSDTTVVDTVVTVKKIEVDQVEVIKSFEVKLGEATRIGIGPKLTKTTPKQNTYDYDVTIVPADITYPDPVIKPLAINPDPKPDVHNFYAKLGYGNLQSPYADLSYFRHIPELYQFTVSGHHYGLDNTANRSRQKFDESSLNINGEYLLGENMLISLDLLGKLDNRNFYGPEIIVPPTAEEYKRSDQTFGGKLGLASAEDISGFTYQAKIGAQLRNMTYENIVRIDRDQKELDLSLEGSAWKSINNKLSVGLDINAYLTKQTLAEASENYNLIDAHPGVKYSSGGFILEVGADLVNDASGFSPWADIELGVAVAEGIQVFAGTDQEVLRGNLSSAAERNPFLTVSNILNYRNSIAKRIYAGVRGKVLSRLTFDFSAGYEDITDQYYFLYDPSWLDFDIDYADVKNIAIDANVVFQLNEDISVGGKLSQNIYDLENLEQLPNLPTYQYEANARIALFNKRFLIKPSLGLSDNVFYNTLQNTGGNSLTDVSVELDFNITNNIAVWVRGNNLLDNEYERFHNYPTVGINGHGGIIVKF